MNKYFLKVSGEDKSRLFWIILNKGSIYSSEIWKIFIFGQSKLNV